MQPLIELTPEVRDALDASRPVVALESTFIALGLPQSTRREAHARVESEVKGAGAVPATIAVVDGKLRVGLDESCLSRLCGHGVRKASLKDLSVAVTNGGVWATTVASTMAVAERAGVAVFATGGIGGVHRKVTETYDESADLIALAKHRVLVVCAGPKAVLDLPRTMERLETLGVPVIGYRTSELPAFYHGRSGIELSHRMDEPDQIARALNNHKSLGGGGMLVVQPPPEDHAQDPKEVEALISRALQQATEIGVQGAALTPFLLSALDVASSGRFVKTNVELVANNAKLAAQIAVAGA